MTREEKYTAFQALHRRPGVFIIPNPWNAGSARILTALGFEALATTSAGYAFNAGLPDSPQALTRNEILANARSIVDATDLPVSADLQNGFGHGPDACAETIRLAAQAGLAGGSIEDSSGEANEPIYDFKLAVERVAAAAEAARNSHFLLTARAENFLCGRTDLHDTIRRLQAFAEAGADVLYAPGLPEPRRHPRGLCFGTKAGERFNGFEGSNLYRGRARSSRSEADQRRWKSGPRCFGSICPRRPRDKGQRNIYICSGRHLTR